MFYKHLVILVAAGASWWPSAVKAEDLSGVVASLDTASHFVLPNQALWLDFTIANTSDEAVELTVPDCRPLPSVGLVGLPLAHVFSGAGFSGLAVDGGPMGRTWDNVHRYQPPAAAETLMLGPHASVGLAVEVTQYYPVLRTPGRFRLTWSPYGGAITSNELIIEVATPKQVVLQTDHGAMTVNFFYEEAPNHVANFLELAREGFYDNLPFRVVPGYYLQNGCPYGDGTGIRPDGRKLKAELSDLPIQRGTVVMARLEDDLDSASSQFLICSTRVLQWDGRYTVFGELVGQDSLDTLDRLMAAPLDEASKLPNQLYLRSVRVIEAPATRTRSTPQLPSRQGWAPVGYLVSRRIAARASASPGSRSRARR